jgi:agmatine deiminase
MVIEPTPRELGMSFPPEWAPHAGTWMSWPRPDGVSFPGRYDRILPNLIDVVAAIATFEQVNINVPDEDHATKVRELLQPVCGDSMSRICFHLIPTNEPWCRDHGPAFVQGDGETAVVNWRYNAWGGKYPPWDDDDRVPANVAKLLNLRLFDPGIVMEGGAVDFNGRGVVLTTRDCLLNPNRNGNLIIHDIEGYLLDYYGQEKVCWLKGGIAGDDTDGHIDDLARFISPTKLVVGVESDRDDVNFDTTRSAAEQCKTLCDIDGRPFEVIEMPMPKPVFIEGERMPATYMNFSFVNGGLVVPTFGQNRDEIALERFGSLLPDRRVVGVDCRELIWGLGAVHCLTQQQPA